MTEAAAARREVEAAGIGHAQPVSPAEPGATLTESSPDLTRLTEADSAVAIANANLERQQSRVDLYRMVLVPVQELLRSLWEQRAALYGETRPTFAEMLKIEHEIDKIQTRIDLYRSDAEQDLDANSQIASELRGQLAAGPAEPERDILRARLTAAKGKAEDAREAIDELKRISLTMRMVSGEIDRIYRLGSLLQWLRSAWVTATVWAKAVWDFELRWVNDTINIEGREVKTTRGVPRGGRDSDTVRLVSGWLPFKVPSSWSLISAEPAGSAADPRTEAELAPPFSPWLRRSALSGEGRDSDWPDTPCPWEAVCR